MEGNDAGLCFGERVDALVEIAMQLTNGVLQCLRIQFNAVRVGGHAAIIVLELLSPAMRPFAAPVSSAGRRWIASAIPSAVYTG
jgi:hypothetical protein